VMTNEEIEYAIDVMAAHRRGEKIEFRRRSGCHGWIPNQSPVWNWLQFDYRIKVYPIEAGRTRAGKKNEYPSLDTFKVAVNAATPSEIDMRQCFRIVIAHLRRLEEKIIDLEAKSEQLTCTDQR
jgi:hypothetical protein